MLYVNKIATAIIIILSMTSLANAEQGFGMQADMIGQGLSWRLLGPRGAGIELVARGNVNPGSEELEYYARGELRLLKFFNPEGKGRIYIGIGTGYFRSHETNYYYGPDSTSLDTDWGISSAVILGLDLVLLQLDDGSGITVLPELQIGYYSFDYRTEPWIGPGAGIGIRYIW
ncbi:hypothetical protein GF359_10575 [candidate division WOR-3 bacterium]|uniref:DUF3575 domain-containing protein n=1 Tax=candidate division WOR-3 bacterium TaxID=2052148 RepID=A0A9D5KDR2_UNCW3|nr:hypothetical protein [candidate division WOR-3 bacterium]MBD3365646.1 hypothetical protein [candidate division WOR-3 bacterium]